MSEKKAVTVTIYKNEYTLKGEADTQHIVELAKYVDTRMTEMGHKSSAPADKIAILVSMNIADELHRLEKSNHENLGLIENLEKNLEEFKASSDNAVRNAAALNEQLDQVRIQLSQEKEKNQAALELKVQAETVTENLKKLVESQSKELDQIKAGFNSTQSAAHEIKSNLETEKEKAKAFETKYELLKKQFEDLEAKYLNTLEELKIAKATPAPAPPSVSGPVISEDRFHFLIKKIETVLE